MKKSIYATKNYYNGIAKGYALLYHDEQKVKINKIKNEFPKSGKLLDIGCGDGVLNNFLSKKIELYSLDISEELLKLNSNKSEYKFQGSADRLPFKENEFDYISSFTVFQDLPNPKKAMREAYRVLKSKGIFYLSFLHTSKNSEILIEEIFKYFTIKLKIKEEKDYIFILIKNN